MPHVTLVYAHRGASAAEAENTVAAFRTAARMGADGVELDVRRTADGRAAVVHDAALPDGRAVAEVGLDDVPPAVPRLAEALDACAGLVVNVEVKNAPWDADFDPDEALAELVVRTLAERGGQDRVIVSSFGEAAVARVRALDPGVPTALLTAVLTDDQVDGLVEGVHAAGHVALHPHHLTVTPHLLERCADAGLAVNTWTVDEPDRIAELAALGVDGVVTNVPDVALRALGR
jgi:glycerophosphoryl diester phosphodiesterase